jgi:hypothetical protein
MGSTKGTGKPLDTGVLGNLARATLETKIVQAGYEPDPASLAVVPPISVSSSKLSSLVSKAMRRPY